MRRTSAVLLVQEYRGTLPHLKVMRVKYRKDFSGCWYMPGRQKWGSIPDGKCFGNTILDNYLPSQRKNISPVSFSLCLLTTSMDSLGLRLPTGVNQWEPLAKKGRRVRSSSYFPMLTCEFLKTKACVKAIFSRKDFFSKFLFLLPLLLSGGLSGHSPGMTGTVTRFLGESHFLLRPTLIQQEQTCQG